jgi:SAM-dependent methyltransferase
MSFEYKNYMQAYSEACERNKGPIYSVLREVLAASATVLEVGSGTGQHAVYFAGQMKHLRWLPTERSENLASLSERIRSANLPNLDGARILDVADKVWPVNSLDAVFTANTLHIMSLSEVTALFAGVGRVLRRPGVLCIYGPFRYQGRFTSDSNAAFDEMLRSRDPCSGMRDIDDILSLGAHAGLHLDADHDLPANNRLLVFRTAQT